MAEEERKIVFRSVERLTHEQARQRERDYWATKTMAERVIAGWELADDCMLREGTDEPTERAAITLRRVARPQR